MRLDLHSIPFHARLLWARVVGAAEAVWPHLWPAVPALFVFCAIGLVGGWQASPLWLHILALVALAGLLGWSAKRIIKAFHWPTRQAALVRLEQASALDHQPLRKRQTGAASAPVHGDETAQALWNAHLERMNAAAAKVKAPKPRLSWVNQDRFAMTSVAILFLALGVLSAGGRAPGLLALSFLPDLGGAPSTAVVTVMAAPPSYIDAPPLLLSAFDPQDPTAKDMPLPAGTTLEITVDGGWRTPVLEMGGETYPLEEAGERSYALTLSAAPSEALRIRQGGRLQFEWLSPIVLDQPPAIAFSDVPERTNNHALKMTYEIFDDYGIEGAALVLIPEDAREEQEVYDIEPPNVDPGALETRRLFKDLTPSKWAGRVVILTLEAQDGLGQTGQSGPLELILPERPFEHPVARELIQQRKRLFFEAGSRQGVANSIDEISAMPDGIDHSLWAFSMLRSAYYRLSANDQPEVAEGVTAQLWAIATFLEDGGVSAQREALRTSLEEMMSALENADAEAFDALAQELESKIADLMAKQMQQMQGQSPTPQMDGGEMRMVDSNTLERMMQQMRDLAAAGDMAGAMQMLEAIQSLMENLNASPGPSAESLAQAQAAQEALDQLEELIAEQRSLMNQTVREALENPQSAGQDGDSPSSGDSGQDGQQQGGQQGSGQYGALSQSQSGLQQRGRGIGEALEEAGVVTPDGLTSAGENMGSAAARLSQERGLPALREQADALRNLAEAQGNMEQQVNQMMQQIRQQSAGRDPFGRPNGSNKPADGQVKIPTEAEAKQARDIRDEIQRRLGEPSRTPLERSYLRRLLERFSR